MGELLVDELGRDSGAFLRGLQLRHCLEFARQVPQIHWKDYDEKRMSSVVSKSLRRDFATDVSRSSSFGVSQLAPKSSSCPQSDWLKRFPRYIARSF